MQMREKLLSITKRALRQILAILTLIFPNLMAISAATRQKPQIIAHGPTLEEVSEYESPRSYEDLAKLLIYLDPVSTGFRHDLLLVIQLGIDNTCLKIQMGL